MEIPAPMIYEFNAEIIECSIECSIDDEEGMSSVFFRTASHSDAIFSLVRLSPEDDDGLCEISIGNHKFQKNTVPQAATITSRSLEVVFCDADVAALGGHAGALITWDPETYDCTKLRVALAHVLRGYDQCSLLDSSTV